MIKISFEKAVNIISYAGDFDLANEYQFYREDIRKATIEKLIENINEKKISCFGDLAVIENNYNQDLIWDLIDTNKNKENKFVKKYAEKNIKEITENFEVKKDNYSNDKIYISFSNISYDDFIEIVFYKEIIPFGDYELGLVNLQFDLIEIKEFAKNPICKEFDFENLQENAQDIVYKACIEERAKVEKKFIEEQKKMEEQYFKKNNLELKNEITDLRDKQNFLQKQLADKDKELEKANKRIEELENKQDNNKQGKKQGNYSNEYEIYYLLAFDYLADLTKAQLKDFVDKDKIGNDFINPLVDRYKMILEKQKDLQDYFIFELSNEDYLKGGNPNMCLDTKGITEIRIKDAIKKLKRYIPYLYDFK